MKPRILAVFPDHPHPVTMGSRVRNLAILEALSRRFDLEIVTQVHDRRTLAAPGPIRDLGRWRPVLAEHRRSPVHRLAGQIRYRVSGRGWNRETWFQGTEALSREVGRCLREHPPDLVHAAYWFSLRRLPVKPRPPLWAVDTHDVQFERWERLGRAVADREREAEIRELSGYDVVVAITPHDESTLRSVLPSGRRIVTIGMGVDLEAWNRSRLGGPPLGAAVAYYGNLASEANRRAAVHLCREILPLLRRLRPDARVVLIGADPAPDVRGLESIPGVRVTGTLDDVRPALAEAGVFALAFRAASGIRSRACEVMALEVPVVAYPEALQGMDFEPGRDYLAARDPEEFAAVLAQVLDSRDLAMRIGAAGREQVARAYSKDRIYGGFVDLYEELFRSSRRS